MKSVILAAGYATRLYPLTENFPKPLLKVGSASILDRLINDIDSFPEINEHIIISNHKFIDQFNNWKNSRSFQKRIMVIDDGSTENENRLGAVKDILFAIEKCSIDEEILVLAGDNLLDFSLKDFVAYQKNKKTACIMRHFEGEKAKLQKTGVAIIDEAERVIKMQEKPREPESNWAIPPFYIYTKEDLPYIKKACTPQSDGSLICGTDAPGDFISWFCSKRPVHAWLMPGKRHDIGDLKSFEEAQKLFT
ncbi:MAG: nucleotidyltransferase family protein [Treponema sp.]|nr:nucleotidyltransferase family protein [Treponema sp.]